MTAPGEAQVCKGCGHEEAKHYVVATTSRDVSGCSGKTASAATPWWGCPCTTFQRPA